MVVPIEIRLIDNVADTLPHGIVDQQAAQQGLLRLNGMGGQTQRGHDRIFHLILRFTHDPSTKE